MDNLKSEISNLKSQISSLPKKPGVYIYKDKAGKVIYIGKAKNLRARVKQYFQNHDSRPQIPFLMKELANFDYTVVNSELESLYLENTLIKEHLPKFNILLRDDKNYAFIKIDYSTQIPQIITARKIGNWKLEIGNSFFGPYSSALKIKNTLNTVRKIFNFCSNEKITGKACFYYHLHRCPGVCVGVMSLDDYKKHLEKIKEFIRGKTFAVHKQLISEMRAAAKAKKFERAARLRDQAKSLDLFEQKQSVILAKKVDWDIISQNSGQDFACVNLFKVRDGKLTDKENFVYKHPTCQTHGREFDKSFNEASILQTFLESYYLEAGQAPEAVYIEQKVEASTAAQVLKNRFHKNIAIIVPQKGKARELIKLGKQNAAEYLEKWLKDQALFIDKNNQALNQLKEVLKLAAIPKRIECYDISNIQGTNAVGSMVVFEGGKPQKSQYRKFKIKSKSTPDDFAMMKEMLSRRIARSTPPLSWQGEMPAGQRGRNEARSSANNTAWPLPDLIVIDGGRGQLSAALEILTASNLQLTTPIIGLAKKIEEIFLPNKPEPIILGHDQPALQLLQRLRDEAHRFGITFHRQLRSKQAVKSALDDIPGIGPKTKKLLKQKFGTVAQIKKASLEELAKIVGQQVAERIKTLL